MVQKLQITSAKFYVAFALLMAKAILMWFNDSCETALSTTDVSPWWVIIGPHQSSVVLFGAGQNCVTTNLCEDIIWYNVGIIIGASGNGHHLS